jgi:hypothetical protein
MIFLVNFRSGGTHVCLAGQTYLSHVMYYQMDDVSIALDNFRERKILYYGSIQTSSAVGEHIRRFHDLGMTVAMKTRRNTVCPGTFRVPTMMLTTR